MDEINIKQLQDYQELINKDILSFNVWVPGTSAATSTNYGRFMSFKMPIQVLKVQEIHETAGSDGGAVTLDVVVVENGSAISTGASILSSTFDLKSTANTLVSKEKRDLANTRKISPTQTLALKTSGTLTAVAGVLVTIFYQYYAKGSFKQ